MNSDSSALNLEEANFATPKWGSSRSDVVKANLRQLSSAHGTERLIPYLGYRSSSEDSLNLVQEGKVSNEKTLRILADLNDHDLLYSSNRKASHERHVSVSLLTDCGKPTDSDLSDVTKDLEAVYQNFAGDLQDAKLDLTLLDLESKEMKARLKVQKRKIASIQLKSMRETAQLHREISHIREFLSYSEDGFLPLQPKSGPGAECCNLC